MGMDVSTAALAADRDAVDTSMPTPDASATCRRSAIRPSETSIIACAPPAAATAPWP
ncbi:hypothetical protein MAHJHV54_47690 [Mycobacterium avium subsp. hominissuis]